MSVGMDYIDKINCLAAYLAAMGRPPSDFDRVASAAQEAGLTDVLRAQLAALDTPRLMRQLEKGKSTAPLAWETVVLQGDQVLWDGAPIGQLRTFYKVASPQEMQARIAYEVFLDRFLSYVQQTFKVAVLHESDADVTLFVPYGTNFDLQGAWQAFVSEAFSPSGLRQTFVPLVNSIRLSERGYSTLDIPIVSNDHALYLAAFYRANLASTEASDAWWEAEKARLQAELNRTPSARDKKRLQKTIDKLEKELETRRKRYGTTYQAYRDLKQKYPAWISKVEAMARAEMGGQAAGRQLSQRGNIVAKYVSEMASLATTRADNFFQLPLLLGENPSEFQPRGGGDSGGDVCYVCGRAFRKGDPKFKANKFIFESPSQRLQSGSGQTEPKVCATCAVVSFVSPIKTGTDRLVIRLRCRDDGRRYLLEDQLRMLTMGELNVMAGRYALLQVSERVPKTRGSPLLERMGGHQYALYKVASLFGKEVFREYQTEVVIGGAEVTLSNRHLAGVRGLIEVFGLDQRRWWEDKGLYAAVGQAVRYIEREEVIFAVYELLKAWRKADLLYQDKLNSVQASRLEQLYETHWRWLMEEKPKEAMLFRDVAAMTGMLYAFCSFVRQSVDAGQKRIEVRKLIERATEPYSFIYTAAGNTKREMATLYRQSDTYFCFDQAKALLTALEVGVGEREGTSDKGTPTLVFYFDDVVNAYTYLFENRYRSSKEQRDFTYTLRLSLHARFPELMEREKGE